MSEEHTTATTVAVESPGETHASSEVNVMAPEIQMMILTWVTFVILLVVLSKFAWKPILHALDEREEKIKKSIEDANKAKEELERIHQTRDSIIAQADDKAKEIVDRSRKAAVEAAHVIEGKAKEEAQVVLSNANHEIKASQEKASAILKKESAQIAVGLASKIIKQNLDGDKQKQLVDQFIQDFRPEDYEYS